MKKHKKISLCVVAACAVISGCSNVHRERANPLPEVFVKFKSEQSAFNNRYALTQRLNNVLSRYTKRPAVIFVASGNEQNEFTLAVSRMYSIVSALDVDADFRVLVKPLDRKEQRDRVAIYHAESWGEFERGYMHDSDFSWVDGASGLYRSADERLLMAIPKVRYIEPVGESALEQAGSLLKQLGWALELIGEEPVRSNLHIKGLQVVTLESTASRIEMSLLLSDVMKRLLPNCEYGIVSSERLVKVWNKKRHGSMESYE